VPSAGCAANLPDETETWNSSQQLSFRAVTKEMLWRKAILLNDLSLLSATRTNFLLGGSVYYLHSNSFEMYFFT
jgi:hypothetical protein